jgi:hypothetical protein
MPSFLVERDEGEEYMSVLSQASATLSIREDSTMGEGRNQERARYAVEIRGPSIHAEVDELAQVLPLVDGQEGRVHVIDRQTRTLAFQGTSDELRSALLADSVCVTETLARLGQRPISEFERLGSAQAVAIAAEGSDI